MNRPDSTLAYRIPEWAAATGLSRSKAYELIKQGRGPRVIRIDGVPLITVADAKAWLESQKEQAA